MQKFQYNNYKRNNLDRLIKILRFFKIIQITKLRQVNLSNNIEFTSKYIFIRNNNFNDVMNETKERARNSNLTLNINLEEIYWNN